MFLELNLVSCIICKYFPPVCRLYFLFVYSFLAVAKAFKFFFFFAFISVVLGD